MMILIEVVSTFGPGARAIENSWSPPGIFKAEAGLLTVGEDQRRLLDAVVLGKEISVLVETNV
jgi:hypothetical protein